MKKLILLLMFLLVATSISAVNFDSCYNFNESGQYNLTTGFIWNESDYKCFNITASDIYIDFNDHLLTFTNISSGNGYTVYVSPQSNNITLDHLNAYKVMSGGAHWSSHVFVEGNNTRLYNSVLNFTNQPVYILDTSYGFVMENVTIIQNSTYSYATVEHYGYDSIIEHVTLLGQGYNQGFYFTGDNISMDHIYINDSFAPDSDYEGIYVDVGSTFNLRNALIEGTTSPLYFKTLTNATIYNVTTRNQRTAGGVDKGYSLFYNVKDVTFIECDFQDYGIQLYVTTGVPSSIFDTFTNFSSQTGSKNFTISYQNVSLNPVDYLFYHVYNLSSSSYLTTNSTSYTWSQERYGKYRVDSTYNPLYRRFILIDEKTGQPFNITSVSSARLYEDATNNVYDLQEMNTNILNITVTDYKWRLELGYADGGIVTRYVDVTMTSQDVRLCANEEGVTHYEQLILSSSVRQTWLRNVFADCYVAADTTRFAYQDSYLLKAFTIDSQYELSTMDDGEVAMLAGVDGSIQSYMNIDQLKFRQTAYDFNIRGDGFTATKSGLNTITLFYRNINEENTFLNLTIINQDNNEVVYNKANFTDPNNFTLEFNYATLSNVTNNTIFKASLLRVTPDRTETLTRYFTITASVGFLNSTFAFIISLMILVFGLSFTIAKIAFSWFGIIIEIVAIAVLTFAASSWFITLLMVIEAIVLTFTFLTMLIQGYATVT